VGQGTSCHAEGRILVLEPEEFWKGVAFAFVLVWTQWTGCGRRSHFDRRVSLCVDQHSPFRIGRRIHCGPDQGFNRRLRCSSDQRVPQDLVLGCLEDWQHDEHHLRTQEANLAPAPSALSATCPTAEFSGGSIEATTDIALCQVPTQSVSRR